MGSIDDITMLEFASTLHDDEQVDACNSSNNDSPLGRLSTREAKASESMRERMRLESVKALIDSMEGLENTQRTIYIVGTGSRGSAHSGPKRYADNQSAMLSDAAIESMTMSWMESVHEKKIKLPPILAVNEFGKNVMSTLYTMLDTWSLKNLSLTCRLLFLLTRPFIHKRLSDHPLVSDPIHLTPTQRAAYEMAVTKRQSIYIAGKAGSGKSVTFCAIAEGLRRVYKPDEVVLAAPTGCAAEVCGGMTLAALFGQMSHGKQYVAPAEQYPHPPYQGGCVDLLQKMKALLIDEISMVSEQDFDLMSGRLKMIKKSKLPFGGVQLVCSGDFAQLPPVATQKPVEKYQRLYNRCLLSSEWRRLFGDYFDTDNKRMVLLPSTIRQDASEIELRAALEELRSFTVGEATRRLLASRSWETLTKTRSLTFAKDNLVLASDNEFVNQLNQKRLELLIAKELKETQTFHATWEGGVSNGCTLPDHVPAVLRLAVGAQVSLTRNALSYRLNNGSLGTVVAFASPADRLTWQRMVESQSSAFQATAENPALLLLSNQNISINVSDGVVTAPPEVRRGTRFPVVRFARQPNALYVVTHWTTPVFRVGAAPEEPPLAAYVHIPLRIAYAATFHRCQGMTLVDDVSLNMSKCFTPEQVYVALSRVRSISQLVIMEPFDARRLYSTFRPCTAVMKLMEMFSVRERDLDLSERRAALERRTIESGQYTPNAEILGKWVHVKRRALEPGSFALALRAFEERRKLMVEERARRAQEEVLRKEEERLRKEAEEQRRREEQRREEERLEREICERLSKAREVMLQKRREREALRRRMENEILEVLGAERSKKHKSDEETNDASSAVCSAAAKLVNITCSVCLEKSLDHALPCGHCFCKECIDALESTSATCPNCRMSFERRVVRRIYL